MGKSLIVKGAGKGKGPGTRTGTGKGKGRGRGGREVNQECDPAHGARSIPSPSAVQTDCQQPALKGRFIIAQGEALGRRMYNHILHF